MTGGVFVMLDVGVELVFVPRMSWRVYRIWPLVIAGNSGRCFATKSGVSSGHDWKTPARIESIHVECTGLKTALCRYVTMSFLRLYSWKFFASTKLETGLAALFCNGMSIIHIPVLVRRALVVQNFEFWF